MQRGCGIEEVHLPAEDVAADVVFFQLGVDRQDDVGEKRVVLDPGMLAEDELDGLVAHGSDEACCRRSSR